MLSKLKKTWIIILIFIVLILTSATLLPLQSNVSESIQFQSNPDALFRQLTKNSDWHHWWPGRTHTVDQKNQYTQEEFTFTIDKILVNTFELQTSTDSFESKSFLRITSNGSEVTLELTMSIPLSHNPIRRINELILSTKLRKSYKQILSALSNHFSTTKNLYGFDIKESKVPYEYVSSLSKTLSHEPGIAEVYELINQVKGFVRSSGAIEQGSPMLFIKKTDADHYFLQVAIPTNTQLSSSNEIKSKWMLKGGFILTARVEGGHQPILDAMKQIEQYIQDHHRSAVAIPYEYLITNRLEVQDTTKWITEVCFPVI